ncbi:MBL fold metallo-hydrolase [Candidatus Dojkabacteria bacterium]|nr:MBL fold metallo-hydrolase [Candidatus Dojkabacteria bacterium]
MQIKFLGASKTVTGSCYLVSTENHRFLVDCGMFQGPDVEMINYNDFQFDASNIDFVILTHAHLDHCGLLPKLVKHGFKGAIYCTAYTMKIAEKILFDSAKLQENNKNTYSSEPIYNTSDVIITLSQFITHDTNKEIVHNDVEFIFRKASHILGAVSVEVYYGNESVTFSGDLGRLDDLLIGHYENIYRTTSNYIMESLYGDKNHRNIMESNNELRNIVNSTFSRDGIVMIPVFALHRSLLMILTLQNLIDQNLISSSTKIVLDSPLAEKLARVYSEFNSGLNLSNFSNLIFQKSDLKRNNKGDKRIILAGGGMANGGRILNYFRSHISGANNSVIFVGFQAEETLGRRLIEGAKLIEIDSKQYTVSAEVLNIEGYSAHADKSELLWWLSRFDKTLIKRIFLTHAEFEKSKNFKTVLEDLYCNTKIIIPEMYHEEELV